MNFLPEKLQAPTWIDWCAVWWVGQKSSTRGKTMQLPRDIAHAPPLPRPLPLYPAWPLSRPTTKRAHQTRLLDTSWLRGGRRPLLRPGDAFLFLRACWTGVKPTGRWPISRTGVSLSESLPVNFSPCSLPTRGRCLRTVRMMLLSRKRHPCPRVILRESGRLECPVSTSATEGFGLWGDLGLLMLLLFWCLMDNFSELEGGTRIS